MEEEKIQTVRDYLRKHFPSADHADIKEDLYKAQTFRVITEDALFIVVVRRAVLEELKKTELVSFFDQHDLINSMKKWSSAFVPEAAQAMLPVLL